MRSDKKRRRLNRKATVETLEVRQVMSADPLSGLLGGSVAQSVQVEQSVDSTAVPELELHASTAFNEQAPDFWLDTTNGSFEEQLYEIEQALASAHGLTGLTQVRENYGFLGTGQTVAVIDSGIAWDHYALGGGLGANYRVVGGWDFTEKDADPYDDGPRGSHGTHVSGIIGANTGSNTGDTGVAPGVDLVGLRVFNDSGAGYFSWVEDALEWVHLNRNSFENPITTVNLSLGTNWNADTVPSWAMLEDEFAQLEADGIFIAVSAGNSFATYNQPGLSYPAASSHVVPVMSVDDSGLLSYYSQRSSRSIAAPGRYIRSTMPDYGGNHNGRTDDWASMSGTSMAAPYVAGASAIVREAMEFIGRANITQQTIYDHMIATADRFFDAATNAYYSRLNLGNAIDALIPDDDFGSSVVDAYDMGSLGGSHSIDGMIGKLDDADYFTFTAAASGTISLTATGTHGLEPRITMVGAAATLQGETWSFDVAAGETYTIAIDAGGGLNIGYYDLDLAVDASRTIVKEIVTSAGQVYELDTEGRLTLDGEPILHNAYNFDLGANGTLYLQSTDGSLGYRVPGGSWQAVDGGVVKYEVSSDGIVYSLDDCGWLSINGTQVWHNTQDFALAPDQTLYVQNTSGLLERRHSDKTWRTVETNVSQFTLRDNGKLYTLDSSGVVKINGASVWCGTEDFAFAANGTLYWQSSYGLLEQLSSDASWQFISNGVRQFAVSHDGASYSLTTSGDVKVDGVVAWSGVRQMRTDETGCLLLEHTNGAVDRVAGRFTLGCDSQATVTAVAPLGSIGPATGIQSLEAAMGAVLTEYGARLAAADQPFRFQAFDATGAESTVVATAPTYAKTSTASLTESVFSAEGDQPGWRSRDYADLDDQVSLEDEASKVADAVDTLFGQVGEAES